MIQLFVRVLWCCLFLVTPLQSLCQKQLTASSIPSDSLTVNSIAFGPNGVVYAATEDGIYRSKNNGELWQVNGRSEDFTQCTGVAVNSKGHIFVSTNGAGIHRSKDGGDSWTHVDTVLHNNHSRSVAINSRDQVFISASVGVEEFVFRSNDNGVHWLYEPSTRYYTFRQIVVDNRDRLYVHTANGLLSSADNGDNRIEFLPGVKMTYFGQDKTSIAVDSLGTVFSGSGYAVVYRTTDEGSTWIMLRPSTDSTLVVTALAATRNGLVFAGLNSGSLMKSADRGDHWTRTSLQMSNKKGVLCISISPVGYIFVGTLEGGIFRSTDMGQTWMKINRGFVKIQYDE